MIKASRRAIFRSVFGRSVFELQLNTANDVLMRVNHSLDPIPVTERMWAAYLAMRRPLRYSDLDSTDGRDIAQQVESVVAAADVRELPKHVAADLSLLLRLETLLRMWAAMPSAGSDPALAERRRQIVSKLEHEIARHLGSGGQDEAAERRIVEDVMECLAKAVGMEPPTTGEVGAGDGAERG